MGKAFACPALALPGDPTRLRPLCVCTGLPASPAHTFHSLPSFSVFPINWGDSNVLVAHAHLWGCPRG